MITPRLEMRRGRTRARLRDNVSIRLLVGVVTSGWWEKGNCETVTRIFEELALDMNVELAGVLLRPHAGMMWSDGSLTEAGVRVVAAARQAGVECVTKGRISARNRAAVERPLVTSREYLEAAARWEQ